MPWSLLFFGDLLSNEVDHHTFLHQRELLESGGHGHWSLVRTDPHFVIDTTDLKSYNELFSEIIFS